MIGMKATWCSAIRVALAILSLGLASQAAAQPAASLDRHRAAVLPSDGFGVDSAETTGDMRWGVNVQLDYANDPAVLGQPDVDRYRPASSFLLWGLLGGGEGGGHPASRDFPAI